MSLNDSEEPTTDVKGPSFPPDCLDILDANVVLRSADQVNFRVHKSVLAMSSTVFKTSLSRPRPLNSELVDGLPVEQLSEDAGLLNSLISLLYPTLPVVPGSYEEVFALLTACQKYKMVSIQSYIRAETKRGTFPAPVGTEAFKAYAVASKMWLIPEKKNAARLTLNYPMTFESLEEALKSFDGRALSDLIHYRKRCRDNLLSCLRSFSTNHPRNKMWECQKLSCKEEGNGIIPQDGLTWLHIFFSKKIAELQKGFSRAISSPSTILGDYTTALKNHASCSSCVRAHAEEGDTFRKELEDELTQALDNVDKVPQATPSNGVCYDDISN